VVSRIRSCFPAASPCRREGRLFLSFLKKTRAAREVAGLAESFAHGPAAVVLCASAGGARVCSGHAQRCACAGLSLANHRARARTHGLKRSRTRVLERVVLLVGGGAE